MENLTPGTIIGLIALAVGVSDIAIGSFFLRKAEAAESGNAESLRILGKLMFLLALVFMLVGGGILIGMIPMDKFIGPYKMAVL